MSRWRAPRIAWVLPASTSGSAAARCSNQPRTAGRELTVARHDGGKAPLRELKRLAERRHTPLVLLPSIPDLTTGDPNRALETAQVPLQAILGALAR
jgi:hypothetical protein